MKRWRIIKSAASRADPHPDRLALVDDGRSGNEQARHVTKPPAKETQISENEIRRLVDAFYGKVRADLKLGPIFERAIPGDWGPHLATMHDFWSSVMLTSGRHKGNPVRCKGLARMAEPTGSARKK